MSYLGPRHVPVLLQHRVRVSQQRASLTRASLSCVSVKVKVERNEGLCEVALKSVLFTLGAR